VEELMNPEISSLKLFGKPFPVRWHTKDRRQFSDGEACYEMVSFEGHEDHDQECLRQGLPVGVTPCWLPNPGYVRNAFREDSDWVHATGRRRQRRAQAAISAYYFPPGARGLLLIDPRDPRVGTRPRENLHAALVLRSIIRNVFNIPCSGPGSSLLSKPGVRAFLAAFDTGQIRFLKNVVQCPMPCEALAFFQQAAQQETVDQLITQTRQTKSALAKTANHLSKAQADLEIAKSIAGMKFQDFQRKLVNTDPPAKMREVTWAKVQRVAWLYARLLSEREVAKKFGTSPKTISTYLAAFERHTNIRIGRYYRHQSVKARLRAEVQHKRQQDDPGELDGA
jgi:hypothetical protein